LQQTPTFVRPGDEGHSRILMIRFLRMVAALGLTAVLLGAANGSVRDCSTASHTIDNCLWLRLHGSFGLPASRLLRAGALEMAGLAILAGLWFVFRYLWPQRPAEMPTAAPVRSSE
jgi:hypothetical protein